MATPVFRYWDDKTPFWDEKTSGLSATSISVYKVRLDRLCKVTGKPLLETIIDANGTYTALQKTTLADSTRKAYVTAVASYLTHFPKLFKRHKAAVARWQEAQRLLSALVSTESDNNVMSKEYRDKSVPDMNQIKVVAAQMKKAGLTTLRESMDYLQLLMVDDMAPKRADYGALPVLKKAPTVSRGNYVIVPARHSDPATLVMNDYKTAKYFGEYREEMPMSVSNALRASLLAFPREYVFVGRNGDKMAEKAYGEAVKVTFRRRMGKDAGPNVLRHAYITQRCNPGQVTAAQRKEVARAMQHTVIQQMSYFMVGGGIR